MDRITRKLIKNYTIILVTVMVLCFILSSFFLSKYYVNEQYKTLKYNAEHINLFITNGVDFELTSNINAILIKDSSIVMIGRGKRGIMPFLKEFNASVLEERGRFTNDNNEEFLYYKKTTSQGELIVFQDFKSTVDYLKLVYAILILVFLLLLLLSIPFILITGKRFTKPILELQEISKEIAAGNFNVDINLKTGDEFETLGKTINEMAVSLNKKYAMQKNFIFNVSHDFRTPLSIIKNYVEAILDGVVDYESQSLYLKEALNGVERLNKLVDSLLKLSKLQSKEYKLNKEIFDLKDLIFQCVNIYKVVADKKNIRIIVSTDGGKVNADYFELLRVMCNFVENAIKFSEEKSSIEVGTKDTIEGIMVFVKDKGIGIDREMMDDIWNRYYKHSQSGGMGLGLAIASEILKAHRFNYGVNSDFGKGSEFYFILPNIQKMEK